MFVHCFNCKTLLFSRPQLCLVPRRQPGGSVLLYGYFVPCRPGDSALQRLALALDANSRPTRSRWTAWAELWRSNPVDPRTGIPLSEPNVASDVHLASAKHAGTHFEYVRRLHAATCVDVITDVTRMLPMVQVGWRRWFSLASAGRLRTWRSILLLTVHRLPSTAKSSCKTCLQANAMEGGAAHVRCPQVADPLLESPVCPAPAAPLNSPEILRMQSYSLWHRSSS